MKRIIMFLTLIFTFGVLASCTIKIGPFEFGQGTPEVKTRYTVDFVTNSEVGFASITVEEGKTFMPSIEPTKEGYDFVGWYVDSSCIIPYDFSQPVTSNLTLYAKWSNGEDNKESCTVYFVVNGGSFVSELTVPYGQALSFDTNPVKDGYTFGGWFTDSAFTNEFNPTTVIISDITLYALWVENEPLEEYTITYVVYGVSDVTVQTYTENEITLAPEDPTRAGYTFAGWYTTPSYATKYTFGNKLTESITLYGKWEVNNYTITYNSNGGSAVSSQSFSGLQTTYEPTEPTKAGYTFAGWYTNSACTNAFSFGSNLTGDITLYAKWNANKYKITYEANGGTSVSSTTFTSEQNTYAPGEPSREGYKFVGWYTDEELTNKFSFGSKLTADITLYAKWEVDIKLSSDATLSSLKVNGSLVANFTPTITAYNVMLSTGTTSFVIAATANDSNATITSGVGTYDIESGNIVNVTVSVKAEDGTVKSYTIIVTAPVDSENETFIYYAGINETIAATFIDSNPAGATAYYRLNGTATYTQVDSQLVRSVDGVGRVDILGLKAGTYDIKVVKSDSTVLTVNGIKVSAQDRTGYAHFDNSSNAIGAYNDDGTLKSNAVVIYVSNATKNTVSYGGYTGLIKILQNLDKIGSPVCIRVLDSIKTNQFNTKSDAPRLADNSNYTTTAELTAYYTNTLETKYGDNLVGLISKVTVQGKYNVTYTSTASGASMSTSSRSSSSTTTYSRSEYSSISGKKVYDDDSYFNMVDITSTKGLTIEGIGTKAEFFQWGMTFNKSKNVEIKNITFTSQPEDACSFQGSNNSDMDYYGFWLHNCTFNRGVNNWDITGERDKYAGDGASDVKFCHGVTMSYCEFDNTKKTGLVGGSDSNYQYNITFHHNYYNGVESRLPLGRQANMHIYNNYYLNCNSTLSIRANAYVFLEGNYFENSNTPQTTTVSSSNYYPQIKGYNNVFNNCSGSNKTQTVSSRTATISNVNCSINGVSYVGFDTNSELFYYDTVNSITKASVLTSPEQAKLDCIQYAGVLKDNQISGILG